VTSVLLDLSGSLEGNIDFSPGVFCVSLNEDAHNDDAATGCRDVVRTRNTVLVIFSMPTWLPSQPDKYGPYRLKAASQHVSTLKYWYFFSWNCMEGYGLATREAIRDGLIDPFRTVFQ
jgi:hypothetical protein